MYARARESALIACSKELFEIADKPCTNQVRYGDRVRVFSRRGNDYTDRVPQIAEAIAALQVSSSRSPRSGPQRSLSP